MKDKIIALLEETMKRFPNGFDALIIVQDTTEGLDLAMKWGLAHPDFTYYHLSMKSENKKGTKLWLRTPSDIPYLKSRNFHHIIVATQIKKDDVDSLKPLLRIPV